VVRRWTKRRYAAHDCNKNLFMFRGNILPPSSGQMETSDCFMCSEDTAGSQEMLINMQQTACNLNVQPVGVLETSVHSRLLYITTRKAAILLFTAVRTLNCARRSDTNVLLKVTSRVLVHTTKGFGGISCLHLQSILNTIYWPLWLLKLCQLEINSRELNGRSCCLSRDPKPGSSSP
jgi:hypothetical protein